MKKLILILSLICLSTYSQDKQEKLDSTLEEIKSCLQFVEKKKVKRTAYDLLTNDTGEDLPLMDEYLISPRDLTESMKEAWSMRNGGKAAPENLTVDNLWLLPSDIHLSGAEIELSHKIGRETRLREALLPIIDNFDYIIIDTPPSLGLLSINAMCAANWVMVPVQAEYYALEGFSMLMNSIKMIQRRINRNLKIFGVAMTMVDARSKLSRHVCDQVNTKMPKKLFKTTIRRLVKVAEAPWSGAPTVLLNKPTNSGAGAGSLEYWTLAKEFHQRVMAMRREFGVNEQPRLLLDPNR